MDPAAPDLDVASDTGAKYLLGALVAFLNPVIQGYAAFPASAEANNQNYHADAQLINGLEGKNLLSALTAFVEAAMYAPPEVESKQENPPKLGMATDEQEMNEVAATLKIPKEVPRSELETKTLDAARAHVFNKMPIRLLAFDKDGSNIQLIGRNQIFTRILRGVFAKTAEPEFQSAWTEAEALKDIKVKVLSAQIRRNKMKDLLEEVVEQIVDYAILSHTWIRDTPGDVTFQDWATREHNPRGNSKIVKFCEVAAQNHTFTLGWIDSVCINKDSSSELDESIRSMYNWYRGASVCITYLSETANIPEAHCDSWFTRGWTFQELLAPVRSVFYNKDWIQLGSSSDAEIYSVITRASGITGEELELCWRGEVERVPFSRRMQMACGRQVTREEDTSYSLMGILGVNISIAYGEGADRAFFRLVRELFNTKKNVIDLFNRSYNYGDRLLPSSLESYQYRAEWYSYLDQYLPLEPIIPTHLGVRIPLLLAPGLVTDLADEENYVPKGVFSGKATYTFITTTGAEQLVHYLLFDSRLYTEDALKLRTTNPVTLPSGESVAQILVQGIVNFGTDNSGYILLPDQCFALGLYWVGLQEGKFTPSGDVIIQAGQSLRFILKYKKGFKIHKDELEEHGMRLVSWYL